MNKYLAILLLFTCVFGNIVLAKSYNKNARHKYYKTSRFQSELNKYCNFNTDYVASHKIRLSSYDEGLKLMQMISDFPNKHKWNKDIDPKGSYLIKKGEPFIGTLYHFEQTKIYSPLLPIPPTKNIYDYYVQESTSGKFKGCVVYSSLPLQYADFEYKLVKNNGKTYIQRTARVIPKLALPKAVVLQKLEESNKKSLKKAVNNILGKNKKS